MSDVAPSFPRQHARTRRFSLGKPRSFTIAEDGRTALFLRSASGTDPVTGLHRLDLETGVETPVLVPGDDDATLSPEEQARRERAREQAGGIVAYSASPDLRVLAFPLGGALAVSVDGGATVQTVPDSDGAYDPKVDPSGRRVAWVRGGRVFTVEVDALDAPTELVGHDDADGRRVTWGVADFAAAEEMGRMTGHWFAPDGGSLAVCRVDETAVDTWHIADPANPDVPAREHRYPAAGTPNAETRLFVVTLDGTTTEVVWDRAGFEYLAVVRWTGKGLLLQVQSRDQRTVQVLRADPATGATTLLAERNDDRWLELVPGTPTFAGDALVEVLPDDRGPWGTNALTLDGDAVTPTGMQVRSVVHTTDTHVWVSASLDDPTSIGLHRVDLRDGSLQSCSSSDGVAVASVGGPDAAPVIVRTEASLGAGARTTVDVGDMRHEVRSLAQDPVLTPNVRLREVSVSHGSVWCAVLLPSGVDHDAADGERLPVLLDPYGGPHAQRVLRSRDAMLTSQWFADQGFAVIIIDNRGTPGRGPGFERAVHRDLATPVLDDQVAALQVLAREDARLDLGRVAMRGWSFGGYLSALAVLRRPDVFRAGIAGAPVTDWALYDTHYTERYLGTPQDDPQAYAVSSLIDADANLLGAVDAEDGARRDLLVIHGLADDNVVAAHSLRLSSALLAAGRPHQFLPLSGVTHMTPQEIVAENLLLLQRDFLQRALAD